METIEQRLFNTDYKLFSACDLNSACYDIYKLYVYFQDGFAYASNGYILVRIPLRDLFTSDVPDEEIGYLNGRFIHASALRQAFCMRGLHILEDGSFQCEYKDSTLTLSTLTLDMETFVKNKMKVPQFARIFEKADSSEGEQVSAVGISVKQLDKLASAMGINDKKKVVRMDFTVKDGVIFVRAQQKESNALGAIMPVALQ